MADLFSLANGCRFAAADNRPEQMRATLTHVARELAAMAGPAPALAPRPAPRNPLVDSYPSVTDIPEPPRGVPKVVVVDDFASPRGDSTGPVALAAIALTVVCFGLIALYRFFGH